MPCRALQEKSAQDPADDVPGMQVDESGNIDLLCDNDMDLILERIYEQSPKAVILDSIQTVSLNGVSGSNGSVSQVPISAVYNYKQHYKHQMAASHRCHSLLFIIINNIINIKWQRLTGATLCCL
jgi:predicted ATP-dependent serine protease